MKQDKLIDQCFNTYNSPANIGVSDELIMNQIITLIRADERKVCEGLAVEVIAKFRYMESICDPSALTDEEIRSNHKVTKMIQAIKEVFSECEPNQQLL